MTLDELMKRLEQYKAKLKYSCILMAVFILILIIMLSLGLTPIIGLSSLRYGSSYVYGIIFITIVFLVINFFKATRVYNKTKKDLLENSSVYENELKHIILNDGDNIYTENYVFFEHGLNICKYDEIIMVYIANTPQRAHMNKDWCMITKKGKIYTVKISEKYLLEKEIMHNENLELDKLLSSKNPNILVGKTKENLKILRKKYKIRGIL